MLTNKIFNASALNDTHFVSVDLSHPYRWPGSSIWMTVVVYMDDGSHPIARRYVSSFSSTFFLPFVSVPSFSVLSSIVYSCCKWCEAASIKMLSHLNLWISVCWSCCERRNDFVIQIRVFHRYSIAYLVPKSRFWQKCLVITEKMISFAVE